MKPKDLKLGIKNILKMIIFIAGLLTSIKYLLNIVFQDSKLQTSLISTSLTYPIAIQKDIIAISQIPSKSIDSIKRRKIEHVSNFLAKTTSFSELEIRNTTKAVIPSISIAIYNAKSITNYHLFYNKILNPDINILIKDSLQNAIYTRNPIKIEGNGTIKLKMWGDFINFPEDNSNIIILNKDKQITINNIYSISGAKGWIAANWIQLAFLFVTLSFLVGFYIETPEKKEKVRYSIKNIFIKIKFYFSSLINKK